MDEKLLEKAREFLRRRYPQIEAAAVDDLAAKMYEDLAEKYIVNAEGELESRIQPVPMPDNSDQLVSKIGRGGPVVAAPMPDPSGEWVTEMLGQVGGGLGGLPPAAEMPDAGRMFQDSALGAIAEAAGAPPRQGPFPRMAQPGIADQALRETLNPWGLDGDQALRDMDPLRVNKELLNPWEKPVLRADDPRATQNPDGSLNVPGLEQAVIREGDPRATQGPDGAWSIPGLMQAGLAPPNAPNRLALNQQILGEEIAAFGMGAQAEADAASALGAPPPPATGPEGLATPPPPAAAPIAGGLEELSQDPTLGSGRDATWMLPGGAGTADITNPTGMAGDLIKQGDEDIEEGITDNELAGMIVGGAGLAAAIGNTIADFRTTRAWEKQLAASAAGDTVARQEGALGGARAQRNIMATSLGRRDISPALAMRNAQMTGARAMSDIYGTAAVESARERRQAEAQLAQLRKRRWNTLFSGLTNAGATVGSFLTAEGAAQAGAAKRGGNDSGR